VLNLALVGVLVVLIAVRVLIGRRSVRHWSATRGGGAAFDRYLGRRAPAAHAVLAELTRGREVGEGEMHAAFCELESNRNLLALDAWHFEVRRLQKRMQERGLRPALVPLPAADPPARHGARARERRPSGISSSSRRRTPARRSADSDDDESDGVSPGRVAA
jgi:hypothetical protein